MEQFDPKRIEEALRIANSPSGKQLIRYLQQSSSQDLQQVMEQTATGDYGKAKQILSQLVKSEELQKYLKQLRGDQNG